LLLQFKADAMELLLKRLAAKLRLSRIAGLSSQTSCIDHAAASSIERRTEGIETLPGCIV
jgi:hypothetical protein